MKKYKILIIGLGSIGKNLALSLIEKGYKISDKVIRHAKVIVSKGKK